MYNKYIQIFFVGLFLSLLLSSNKIRAGISYSQLKCTSSQSINDTVYGDSISLKVLPKEYQSLKKKTSGNKITRKIFSWMIREPSSSKRKDKGSMVHGFSPYAGMMIRRINIRVLSPFGTDVNDPDSIQQRYGYTLMNNSHINTKKYVIRKYLQFKSGDYLQPALLAESEALLRRTRFINDARIIIVPIEGLDLVDVDVIVRDKWTIALELHKLTGSATSLELKDGNILGTGSEAALYFNYSTKYDQKFGLGGNYRFQNIRKTAIDFELNYEDNIKFHELNINLERKLQPRINYFGEVSYWRNVKRTQFQGWDSISPDLEKRFSVSIGRAFTLTSSNSIKRIVLGLRYKNQSPEYRNNDYRSYVANILLPYKYTSSDIWLMQLTLYKNAFIREYMINNFGTTEDIAQGYNISIQSGYSKFPHIPDAFYSSFSASLGTNTILKGYLYGSTSISSFFDNKPFLSLVKFDGLYYSPLFGGLLDGRVRQFAYFNYWKLLSPDRFFGDRIYMGQYTSFPMRKYREMASGVEQIMFKTETNLFSKYEILGVRSVFYTFLDVCWITPDRNLFRNENLNWGIGVGIRLRNDLFILRSIDLKIGYYPRLDQRGFRNFFRAKSSPQQFSPNFIPSYPQEIVLE